MDSLAACAMCTVLTAGKSNHSVAKSVICHRFRNITIYQKSWSVRASNGEIHGQLWQNGRVDVVGMLVGVNELWMLRRRVANLWKKLNCDA